MPIKNTLESRMLYRIKRGKNPVFLRKDFEDMAGYDQVGRILRQLVRKRVLIYVGYGAYVRAKESSINGNIIPEISLQELAKQIMLNLKVKVLPTQAEQDYNQNISTQVPTGRVIGVNKRVARKIGYNGIFIKFEKVA